MSTFAIEKSEQMVKKLKNSRYKEIFDELLPDNRGFINKETVYKSELDPKIKGILKPLLEELNNYDEYLSFEEFYDAMEMLMKSVSLGEKSLILRTNKKRNNTEDYDFKPKTNPKRTASSSSMYQKLPTEEIMKGSPIKPHMKSLNF